MRRDRHTTPDTIRTQDAPHGPRARHRCKHTSDAKRRVYMQQTGTKSSASVARGTELNLCKKNQQRNGKNKRMRPRQRPKSNAATGPITRGPTSAAVGAAEAAVAAVSTSASLHMSTRKLRHTESAHPQKVQATLRKSSPCGLLRSKNNANARPEATASTNAISSCSAGTGSDLCRFESTDRPSTFVLGAKRDLNKCQVLGVVAKNPDRTLMSSPGSSCKTRPVTRGWQQK